MSKKRVMTIVNIICCILMIVGIFLPIISNKSLFASEGNIVVNLIDRKVEYGLISSGFVLFYLLQLSWGIFFGMAIGFYLMFFGALILMILTIIYGFLGDLPDGKQNVHSQFRSNGRVMNGYPNRNANGNMQMPYPNQMMYRNGQVYNNNGNFKR